MFKEWRARRTEQSRLREIKRNGVLQEASQRREELLVSRKQLGEPIKTGRR